MPSDGSRVGPLFGFPVLDQVEPRVEKKRGASVAASSVTFTSKLGKRRGSRKIHDSARRRTPLDVFGSSAQRTRDQIGHMNAAVQAHLTRKQLEATGLVSALQELAEAVAKDMQLLEDTAWKKGVAHGEWLREGEVLRCSDAAAAAEVLKRENFQLKFSQYTLHNQLAMAVARVEELTPAPPPNSAVDELTVDELLAALPAEEWNDPDDRELRRALSDLTNLL